jgi:hypothetical protein
MDTQTKQRFRSRVNNQSGACELYPEIKDTECWMFASKNYGSFRYKGKLYRANRFAWILRYGSIPEGYCVCHKCDNKPCVRHLFIATQTNNIADMDSKQRRSIGKKHGIACKRNQPDRRGERHGRARLLDKDAVDIRILHKRGIRSIKELHYRYKVAESTIRAVLQRITFKHV